MRNLETLTRDVRAELARITNTQESDWFLVFKARYGMEAVLQAVAHTKGRGEVITQPFTCATAINPILSTGHIPLYIDTSYTTLSLDTSKLQASSESRAVIVQHSFGIEADMERAREFADKHALLVIEDSAHQLGMMSRKNNQPLADISVHSFGVEKLLPTKFGGAIWVNPNMKDHALRDAVRSVLSGLPLMTPKQSRYAKRYRPLNHLLNHTPTSIEPLVRSLLIKTGLFQPAIMPKELEGQNLDAPARPDAFVVEAMLKGLRQRTTTLETREKTAALYTADLSSTFTLPWAIPEHYAPARFPVLCRSAEEAAQLFDALREKGYYSGKWYRPVLFPGVHDAAAYNYDAELYPVAEDISARILNLPTNTTANAVKEIADVLHRETNR